MTALWPDIKRFVRDATVAFVVACSCGHLFPRTAWAHPPYEHVVGKFHTDAGQEVQIIKSYVDGVFSVDPVKLVLRDADGRTLTETEYARDVVTSCGTDGCHAYRFDSALSIAPSAAYRTRDGALLPSERILDSVLGVLFHLREHWVGYAISVAVVALLQWMVGVLVRHRWGYVSTATLIAATAPMWCYAVAELSRLSLTIAAILACVPVVIRLRARPSQA